MTQNSINNAASILAVDNLTLDGNTLSSTDTDGDIVLFPDGTGTVSVTLAPIVPTGDRADSLGSATNSWDNVYADGLTFDDGTNVLANFIDKTSWTPVLEFGAASVGITYGAQTGFYSRIGSIIFFYATITLTSKGSSTGTATVDGLPVTIGNFGPLSFRWGLIDLATNYTVVTPVLLNATTTFRIDAAGDNVATVILTDAAFADTSRFDVYGWYFV